MTKQEEYDLMVVSKPQEFKTLIPGGQPIKWLKTWDHHNGPTATTFKTTTPPPYEHKLISYKIIDLMPIRNLKIYQVTIKKNH
jgi:hypothetical protein